MTTIDWTSWRSTSGATDKADMNDDIPPPGDADAPDGDATAFANSNGDGFAHALKEALGEIRQRLGQQKVLERVPLFVAASELFVREYPPTQWRVTGLISEGGVVMLDAEPKW